VLLAATLYVALFSTKAPVFRAAAALFSLAALLGVLRFSGLYPEEALHKFASMIVGVAAFPSMAISLMYPRWRVIGKWSSSLVMLLTLAIIGTLDVTTSESRIYLDVCALLSVAGVAYASLRTRCWRRVLSAAIKLVGLMCFALKIPLGALLQPADVLHLALAAGWLHFEKSSITLSE